MNISEFNHLAIEAVLALSMNTFLHNKENDIDYWIDELNLSIQEGYYRDKLKKETSLNYTLDFGEK